MFRPAEGAIADVDPDVVVAQSGRRAVASTASSSMISTLQTRRTSWPSTAA
jgi:hypothetical protein